MEAAAAPPPAAGSRLLVAGALVLSSAWHLLKPYLRSDRWRRALIIGGPTATPLLQALAWLLLLGALFISLALRHYHHATQ